MPIHKTSLEKVIINTTAGVKRGFIERPQWDDIEKLLRHSVRSMPEVLQLRESADAPAEKIDLASAKAIFFVNSFEGRGHRKDLKFYSHAPIVHGVWVQVQFEDGEVLEGIVHNSKHHLLEPGFFLLPSDPDCNNRLVYVVKSALKDYRVLGLRQISPLEA